MYVQLRYNPQPIAANTTAPISGAGIGGFAAVTAGTITVADSNGTNVLTAFPVAAGQVYSIPLFLCRTGSASNGTFTTAGGASGTIFVQ